MIPLPDYWSDRLRHTLGAYAAPLLRRVAGRLIKTRNQWPAEELIERCITALGDAALVDRRLKELDTPARRLLACVGHSRQPRWKLGNLLELLACFDCAEGPQAVFRIFEAGLLYPDLSTATPLEDFEQWLGQGSAVAFAVFAYPPVMARAVGTDLGLPVCSTASVIRSGAHEADGLEWPLRLAALWQLVQALPLRRTQQGGFFKRDLDRLRGEPLLSAPPADSLAEVPDPGLLTVGLAQHEGVLLPDQEELRTGTLPENWDEGLVSTLTSLWTSLPLLEAWNPRDGWCAPPPTANPYPSAYLLLLLLLANLPEGDWADPKDLEQWLLAHHPFWSGTKQPSPRPSWVGTFLLGVAFQLRMVQAARDDAGEWVVRLSAFGRGLLGISASPSTTVPFSQTLLTQPNLEIVVYRQALTPGLISRLSRFANWKGFGSACTLQIQADAVYRALENGFTFDRIVQTLEQHGMRPTPPAVIESLRTWADKRERISVYPSATLFEFAEDSLLNEALARGLPGVRLSERMLLVTDEQAIDFRHFRLTGTRDYGLPPEKCVTVDSDGVTLAVDVGRSDLLLETELQRFAESVDSIGSSTQHRYRLTPTTLANATESGLGVRELDEWFVQRSGMPLSAAARLLLCGSQAPPLALASQLVLRVATAELADGLLQWPGTRPLIRERLGPTSLVIALEDTELLRQRLDELGVKLTLGPPSASTIG
jgi:hypothetical protein